VSPAYSVNCTSRRVDSDQVIRVSWLCERLLGLYPVSCTADDREHFPSPGKQTSPSVGRPRSPQYHVRRMWALRESWLVDWALPLASSRVPFAPSFGIPPFEGQSEWLLRHQWGDGPRTLVRGTSHGPRSSRVRFLLRNSSTLVLRFRTWISSMPQATGFRVLYVGRRASYTLQ
jgi:hypothetical protein